MARAELTAYLITGSGLPKGWMKKAMATLTSSGAAATARTCRSPQPIRPDQRQTRTPRVINANTAAAVAGGRSLPFPPSSAARWIQRLLDA